MKPLPQSHFIMPYAVDHRVPGFEREYVPGIKTLAPAPVRCEDWFNVFCDTIINAIGRHFLPVCRISDGEFKFLLGHQPLGPVWPYRNRIKSALLSIVSRSLLRQDFKAGGRVGGVRLYGSGSYSATEWQEAREGYSNQLRMITHKGVLAIHLTYGTPEPFQQHYFPAFGAWLCREGIRLTVDNYVPFYFVYALLRGNRKEELLLGRRVIVVHGATGEKRESIISGLKREGVDEVQWVQISSDRSLFDRVDCESLVGKADLCLVGAGIGKPNVIMQLASLQIPCIDAGYVFEVWAHQLMTRNRPYMVPDMEQV